eukprot:Nitzschia sp. Nitz4//scaffold10_size219509//206403//207728//NITZ4_001465-RA/size219509-processed-gene-0.103-mRNA-1//1//CDS//3329533031//5439//frame0
MDATLMHMDSALVSTALSTESDLDTSFTCFDDILRQDTSRVWTLSESAHSRTESPKDFLQDTQDYLLQSSKQMTEYTESIRLKGEEYANSTQEKVDNCTEVAHDTVKETVDEFFSPAQNQARAKFGRRAIAMIRNSLGYCHDSIDAILVQIFDQPLREVEVRADLDQLDQTLQVNESLTDELTIDSSLTKRAISESIGQEEDKNLFLVPSNSAALDQDDSSERPLESIESAICEDETEVSQDLTDSDYSAGNESEQLDDVLADDSIQDATESDDESVRRFREELYMNHRSEELATMEHDLEEHLQGDDEPVSIPSIDSDIVSIDNVITTKLEEFEREGIPIEGSISTPLRDNRRFQDEAIVDLTGVYQDDFLTSEPTFSKSLDHKTKAPFVTRHSMTRDLYATAEHIDCCEMEDRDSCETYNYAPSIIEPVIDLTMYEASL